MHLLGSDTHAATWQSTTNAEARRVYEQARRRERQNVFEKMETFFNDLAFTAQNLRGASTARVYDPPDRND